MSLIYLFKFSFFIDSLGVSHYVPQFCSPLISSPHPCQAPTKQNQSLCFSFSTSLHLSWWHWGFSVSSVYSFVLSALLQMFTAMSHWSSSRPLASDTLSLLDPQQNSTGISTDTQGWGCNLRPWWFPVAMLLPKPFPPEWPFLPPRARQDVVQALATARDCVDVCGLCYLRRP